MRAGAPPPRIVRTLDELEPVWLSAALGSGAVADIAAEQIGTGQMSESHRLALAYEDPERAGPASVVVKLAASDATSRGTGVGLGIYEREVRFYRELAPRIGGPLARCWLASYDEAEGWFTLLLEDVAPAAQGDQIAGASVEQVRTALHELARLHAPVLEDDALAASEWLNRPSPIDQPLVAQLLAGLLERYGERVAPEHRNLCERFTARLDPWLDVRRPPQGIVHGDFRLDNLLFGEPGCTRPLTVLDWQTVGWGGAMADAAYFIGGSLPAHGRRAHERDLFGEYHEELRRHGARPGGLEECWREYRRLAFGGVLMAIVAPLLVERTQRGDEMFMTMLARHSQHALDLESERLLADTAGATRARPAAPRPAPTDERAHEPGPEQLWNESWYFDVVAPDGSFGAWLRLGLYPRMGVCWYTALACAPGRPTLALVDYAAPLPQGDDLRVRTDALRAEHRCAEPLERFEVALEGEAEAHGDPAAVLRGERAQSREPLALELAWDTDGTPYSYRMTTRYEIPCRVRGSLRAWGQTLELDGAPGQRDHSWGLRDWWAMDWMWSALHLRDRTHLHAIELRLPDAPRLGVGYVQAPGEQLVELERVSASEQVAPDGLITAAALEVASPGLRLALEPLAFGPLRLVSPDGRVAHFPRAMCRLRCEDGREGLGWVEWNLNQR